MDKYIKFIRERLRNNKKKITKILVISGATIITIGAIGAAGIYGIVKSNTNYTVEEAQVIALQEIQGDVLSVRKNIEFDELTLEYEFKIKDVNNRLYQVTVNSNYGTITDIDDYR